MFRFPLHLAHRFSLLLLLCGLPLLLAAQGYHHVIAGSFDNLEAASRFHDALKAKGENPFIVYPQSGQSHYRVSVYSGTDRATADEVARQARKKGQKYWVMSMMDKNAAGVDPQTARTPQPATGEVSRGQTQHYHLIAASLQSLEAATKAVQELKASGFEPYLIMPRSPGGMYRVSIYRADTEKEAQTYNKMLKRRGKSTGWTYAEEPGTITTHGISVQPARRVAGSAVTYHLIGGSVRTFTQAHELAEAMRAKGHEPLIMFPEPGISTTYRVSVFRATDRNQVTAYQKQKKVDGWIFELK